MQGQQPELATATGSPSEVVTVDDEAAAQRGSDQDVEKTLILLAQPEVHLTHRGGSGVVLDEDRYRQGAGQQSVNGDGAPDRVLRRLAGQRRFLDVVRKRDPEADESGGTDPGLGEEPAG